MSETNRSINTGVSAIKRAQGRNALKRQRIAIICIATAVVVLVAALIATLYITSIYTYDDVDGTVYLIKKVDGEYALCYKDGKTCATVTEGSKLYYTTALGTMVEINGETGEAKTFAVVHLDGTEVRDFDAYVLMYKQLTYDKGKEELVFDEKLQKYTSNVIASIEIKNSNGTFAFVRDENGNIVIKGHKDTPFSAEMFAELSGACGYTLASRRLKNPVLLPDGNIDFAEYGLAPETRTKTETDDEGNEIKVEYEYTPTVYTITTLTGESHTVTVGDKTVTGDAYYAKYEGRDTIYVLSSQSVFGRNKHDLLSAKIETFVTPIIVYPMGLTDYFNVSDFVIYDNIDYKKIYTELSNKFTEEQTGTKEFLQEYERLFEIYSHKVCDFYFSDLIERQGTMFAYTPYISNLDYAEGYYLNHNNVDIMLSGFYKTEFAEVVKLSPSTQDLCEYGLSESPYVVGYVFKTKDDEGKADEIENFVEISQKTEDGFYYAYSSKYDMIVSVKEASFAFLEWDETQWYDEKYIQLSISDIESILIESPEITVEFEIEDSASKYLDFIFRGVGDITVGDKKYQVEQDETGRYVLKIGDTKVSPLYTGDYMITPVTYTVGERQADNYLFYEIEEFDLNKDGQNDSVLYRAYDLVKIDGKYVLAASSVLADYNGNPIDGVETKAEIGQIAYSSEFFKTNNGYLYFVSKGSAVGTKLDTTYGKNDRGQWGNGNVFVTSKGQLVLINDKTGEWMFLSAVTSGLYLADSKYSRLAERAITIPELRGENGKIQRYGETFYPLTDKPMMYDDERDMIVTYNKLDKAWEKVTYSECTIGVWGNCEYYVLDGGLLILVDTKSGEWGEVGVITNSTFIADIYANGQRLDYQIAKDGYSESSKSANAMQNFQELYKYMLSASFEDLAEIDDAQKEAFKKLDDFTSGNEAACVLKITMKASDLKGNERDVVYRFYRYSERRAYLTIEILGEDGSSSSEKAYGNFCVLYSFVQKVIADAQRELDQEPIYSNNKY